MNLSVSGHHLEVTPAIRSYVQSKIGRVTRHFDHVIDAHVILTADKLKQKAEVTVHLPGKDISQLKRGPLAAIGSFNI